MFIYYKRYEVLFVFLIHHSPRMTIKDMAILWNYLSLRGEHHSLAGNAQSSPRQESLADRMLDVRIYNSAKDSGPQQNRSLLYLSQKESSIDNHFPSTNIPWLTMTLSWNQVVEFPPQRYTELEWVEGKLRWDLERREKLLLISHSGSWNLTVAVDSQCRWSPSSPCWGGTDHPGS